MSNRPHINEVLAKASGGRKLTEEEVVFLLRVENDEEISQLFRTARLLRSRYFANRIFLYGFVYFSTWCRNDCAFCLYCRSNDIPHRYRKSTAEILAAAESLASSGVHLIDLTMGEDTHYYRERNGAHLLAEVTKKVKESTGLPVMVSPGVATEDMIKELAKAGADWYACYQETYNRHLFSSLRLNQSFDQRLLSKQYAKDRGLLVEEGIMTGVGEEWTDVADSLLAMGRLGAHQVRVMSFVPQEGSAMNTRSSPERIRELKIIAVLRLLYPDRLIPASLDVDGVEGLPARLDAGANVVTSLIPPDLGLAGVAQHDKDINEGSRSVPGIMPLLSQMGLVAASPAEYRDWVIRERRVLAERHLLESGVKS